MTEAPTSQSPHLSHDPSRPRIVPDFAIIGAAKAGTTTLSALLERHPQIAMAPREPEFFCESAPDADRLRAYEQGWEHAREGQLKGEKSTGYTRYPEVRGVPARLAKAAPQAALVYLVRHPIERAFSHYLHRCRKELYPGRPIPHPFERHMEVDPMVVNGSDYRMQIERYLEHFPRQRLHVVLFEDLTADPVAVAKGVLGFLGLQEDDGALREPTAENVGRQYDEHVVRLRALAPLRRLGPLWELRRALPASWRDAGYRALRQTRYGRRIEAGHRPPPMLPETRRSLVERYRESNAWLGEFLGRDLEHWNR